MTNPVSERIGLWLLRLTTYAIVASIVYVLGDIVCNGIGTVTWEFLSANPSHAGAEGGIWPVILGTLYLSLGTMTFALPIGMAAAIYLTEYANSGRLTGWIRLAVFTLAGVPSIVFGLFGLGLFVIFFGFGASILSGSLTLALMSMPVVIVASEEALRAVPTALRTGSLALGATRWQTIWRNVLPYSVSGMLTGSILGLARAAGETAPILFTAAAFFLPRSPGSIFDQVMALPYHLYILATQHPDADLVRPRQYATALVLVGLVLGINLVAIVLRNQSRKKYRW